MARNLPTSRRPMQPQVRPVAWYELVPYFDPATGQLLQMTPGQLAAKQRKDAQLYARYIERRDIRVARERKARRFWLGFGLVIGVAFLIAMVVLGWLIWSVAGLGILAVPVVIGLSACVAVGGHRCITIVQHTH
jgi:hypothetical protein